MKSYIEAIDNLPDEFRWPLVKAFEIFREEIADTVKKADFDELKAVVAELAEAQKRTDQRVAELAEAQKKAEERLTRLEITVQELIEAQKKAEERLTRLEITVQELIEAQKKAEERLTRLELTVEELIEAQKKTEQRVNELAEAQKKAEERLTRLEVTVQELIETQKKTEQAIQRLTQEQIKIKEELGGLSHTVGYRLEDEAMKAIPKLLKQDFGVEVVGRLKRDLIEISKNNYIEVNIFGEGRKNGKEYMIVGEAKSQLKKRNIDDFLKKVETLKRHIGKEPILLYVTYISHPQVRKYAEEKNIKIYHSYEL
jgi:chromosome segregation ATPase